MTGSDATLEDVMGATAVVQFSAGRLELYRHPSDGHVVAFEDSDAAFAFAVSVELAGGSSAGTVEAPASEALHMLAPGVTALDLTAPMERAA